MNINDLNKATDLVKALDEGLQTQKVVLEGLVTSLEAYREFLAEEIVEAQRRSGKPTTEEVQHV